MNYEAAKYVWDRRDTENPPPETAVRWAKDVLEHTCTVCQMGEGYFLHKPARDCEHCKAPSDHHNFSTYS